MLTPGPETDLKMAQACGLEAMIGDPQGHGFGHSACYRWVPVRAVYVAVEFAPTTDLNDAFFAAEMASFIPFTLGCDFRDKEIRRWWVGSCLDVSVGVGPEPGFQTPALALCAAIFKFKESP